MAAMQNLRDSFARLSPREKMLVGACFAAIFGFILFLVIHYTGGKMHQLSSRVEKQDEDLVEIMRARGKFSERESQFRGIQEMLKRPAPALRGFLENKAKALGMNIQEYKDLPTIQLGRKKDVEERSIVVYPVKPNLKQLANFMAQVENTREHFLVVKDLRVDRAFDNHDEFQRAEITVATYALVNAPAGAPGTGPNSGDSPSRPSRSERPPTER